MVLTPGTRVGPFEVTGHIGVGGMGEVYRATDSNLKRSVAIKVLPAQVAADADRLARFQREAEVLAALNHPNIATIYGLERAADFTALIMELVEGEDLSAVIARGPVALADALPIARQIADALEAAHEQGIIHRDLKPQNIKVRADGTVKVLDFGLAKALVPDAASASTGAMDSPTLSIHATQAGIILGTAAYMSPEQARGKPVDRRADIWAFGVVLYEMLTGRRAFHGEDISITLASVLKEDVSWDSLPAGLPIPIVRLLRRCLEKEPKRRLSSIGDARIEIDDALHPSPGAAAGQTMPAPAARHQRLPWIVAGLTSALLLVALGAMWMSDEQAPPPPVVEFTVPVEVNVPALELSPDGRMLAFVDRSPAGAEVIWIRPLAARDASTVPGTEGAIGVFWSPDSQSLGFMASGKLQRIAVSGGPVQTIAEVLTSGGATWAPDDTIVFGTGVGAGGRLYRVSASGGVPAEIARPDPERQEAAYMWPTMLPDGRRFIYLALTPPGAERAAYVASLDGGAPVRLMVSESQVKYAAPGQLLFTRASTLFAQPFDAATLTLTGEAVRVADEVDVRPNSGRAVFSVSSNGVLAYRSGGGSNTRSTLTWFDRTGTRLGSVGDPSEHFQIRLSPDGTRVALSLGGIATQTYRLSVLDLANGVTSTVSDTATPVDPVWLPDNETIGYSAFQSGVRQIFRQKIGQSNATQVFTSADNPKWLDDWSADGAFLLFHVPRPSKLFAVKVSEPTTPLLLLDTTETVDGAHFSPDGKWVVYLITEDGTFQVWVASFPAFDQRRRVSPRNGGQAFWRGDGKELFYLTPDGKMMSARVTRDDRTGALSFSAPTELFQSPIAAPQMGIDQYSVTKDGQRFLFIEPVTTGASPPIAVVVNWTSGLGAK